MSDPIAPGLPAPPFELLDDEGRKVSLEGLRGRTVVLFFYADDDTPVCTTQACGFRDLSRDFTAEGAVVYGVGADAAEAHAAFRKKHKLPFSLLVDPAHEVATRYGAWGEKIMYGKPVVGVIRGSVVIGPHGNVAAVSRRVQSKRDAPGALAAVRALSEGKPAAKRRAPPRR